MEKYKALLPVVVLLMASLASRSEEPADTVKVIENASNILVVAKDGKTTLTADYPSRNNQETFQYQYEVNVAALDSVAPDEPFSENWGMDIPFIRDKSMNVKDNKVRRYVGFLGRLYWGWRFNYDGKENVKNSWELSVPDILSVKWRRRGAEFEIGAGITHSHYTAQDNFCYGKEGDRLVLVPTPEDMKVKNSSLNVFAFQLPLFYNQNIGKDVSFSLGAIANFNAFAEASTKLINFEEQSHKMVYKDLQQRFFTVDVYASFSLFGVGMFAKWSPMRLFNKQFGPQPKGFTIGVELLAGDLLSF